MVMMHQVLNPLLLPLFCLIYQGFPGEPGARGAAGEPGAQVSMAEELGGEAM